MGLLPNLPSVFQPPAQPSGNPAELAGIRESAFRALFSREPHQVFAHDLFEKPYSGGPIEVRVYTLCADPESGPVLAAVTSGLSDYRMMPPDGGRPYRREIIQYFREYSYRDMERLHGVAWLPLASRFPLNYGQTVGPLPGDFPQSLFLTSPLAAHAGFKMQLNGDEFKLLWHVPLRPPEADYKARYGVDALAARLQASRSSWIFDPSYRLSLL